MQHTEFV